MNTLQQMATSPDQHFNKEECHRELRAYHHKLFDLQNIFFADGRFSLLIILQGVDTAGEDGTIRHVLSCMNPMGIQVKSFKTPTAEELQHDFLWRIFPHLPAKGMMEVFDRSYYEDIVIPYIGKKLTKEKLHERCELINAVERHLEDSGTHILKFFLNLSYEEQMGRIKGRMDQPRKQWKYNLADKMAASKYDDYMDGYDKIINECHSKEWHIIPADQKWYRNYAVAKILTEYLEALPLKLAAATAGIVLVNSNPKDIVSLILFGKATYRKMIQNLIWATGYNVIALPLAAGVLYKQGVLLSPAAGAGLMTVSTIVVAINAGLLKIKG